MGTDWGIGCRDCAPRLSRQTPNGRRGDDWARYFTDEWDNCRDVEALAKICAAAREIVALDAKLGELMIISWTGHVGSFGGECHGLAEFLRAHEGHSLAPMDEYRQFDGESGRCEMEKCYYGSLRCDLCRRILCDRHHGDSGCEG